MRKLLHDEQSGPDPEAERKEIRTMLGLMRDNYERGLYEGEEYQYWQKVNSLKEKLELLNRIPEVAIERAARTLLNLHNSWEWATREERKMLVRAMIQEAGCDVGTKNLSEKCQVKQDMSTGQLDKGHPVTGFLRPASTQTAAPSKPGERSFDDPAASRVAVLSWKWAFFFLGFVPSSPMLDMINVSCQVDDLVNIIVIIAFVTTEVLFLIRSLDDDGDHQIIGRPLVMLVGTANVNGQRSAMFVHQQMNFAAQFATIGRILARFRPTQGSSTRFAIHRLPFPANFAFPGVELDHDFEQLVKYTGFFPGLKALMQNAAGNMEPFLLDRFPLAASPQDIPDAVDHISVIHPRSSRLYPLGWFRNVLLQLAPKFARDLVIVNILRFCVILIHRDVLLLSVSCGKPIFSRLRLFFQPFRLFG